MRKGDRYSWSSVVGWQHGTDYPTTTATRFASDHRIHPVSWDSPASRCHAALSGPARR